MDPHIWPGKTRTTSSKYIQQLCEDTGCSHEDLPEAMNDREKWRERVMDIGASGTTWWWSKVGDRSKGRPEGSLFNSYYTEMQGRAQLLSLYCSTLPLIRTLYCWVLRKEVSSAIWSLVWHDLGLNPGLPDHWRTLYPLGQWAGTYFHMYDTKLHLMVSFQSLSLGNVEYPFITITPRPT